MTPQHPAVSGVGHGAAMSTAQPQIEKIHGSDYGVMREGGGRDVTGTVSESWFLVMKKVSGEYMPAPPFPFLLRSGSGWRGTPYSIAVKDCHPGTAVWLGALHP